MTATTTFNIPFGSIVYETYNARSDVDVLKIVEGESNPDLHIYTPEEYQLALDNHEVVPVETYYWARYKLEGFTDKFKFNLDRWKLRQSFSAVSSNSWVKCKKKLADGETYIGLKSLFHSLRIISNAYSIARDDYILWNWAGIYKQIMADYGKPWEHFNNIYKLPYNELHSKVRKECPK